MQNLDNFLLKSVISYFPQQQIWSWYEELCAQPLSFQAENLQGMSISIFCWLSCSEWDKLGRALGELGHSFLPELVSLGSHIWHWSHLWLCFQHFCRSSWFWGGSLICLENFKSWELVLREREEGVLSVHNRESEFSGNSCNKGEPTCKLTAFLCHETFGGVTISPGGSGCCKQDTSTWIFGNLNIWGCSVEFMVVFGSLIQERRLSPVQFSHPRSFWRLWVGALKHWVNFLVSYLLWSTSGTANFKNPQLALKQCPFPESFDRMQQQSLNWSSLCQ